PQNEVSRATPIAAEVAGQAAILQGTFELPTAAKTMISAPTDVATFAFPYLKGHMRARLAASIDTAGSSFSAGTILFDAAATGKIPAANNTGCASFNGSCRNVFTVTQTPNPATGVSLRPARVQLNDGTADTIGALIAPAAAVAGIGSTHWRALVRKVIAAPLGGVDRSTVAMIGPSSVAGLANRPSIVYFGAADGMLHAVCASTGGTTETATNVCPSLGTEIWAFVPRVQLPMIRKNTARIDGSVRVIDAFGDFTGTGQRAFRTILTVQTGSSDVTIGARPAVYALDVTDPANPIVLWEYTAPTTSPSAAELGTGLTIAAGTVLFDSQPQNLAIAQTNNGGTGGTGVVATALSLETGARLWRFGYVYPTPPRGDATALPLPITGIPGGAVGVDLQRQGFLTDVVMGDLYGNLWRLDAATGVNRTGNVPLFSFSRNKKPIGALPAIYSDGNQQFAVFGSGGYADPLLASWSSGTQSLVSVPLAAPGPYPLTETSTSLAFVEPLAAGVRAFAQVLIVGTEVFLSSDSADVNSATYGGTSGTSGSVLRYDLATSMSTVITVRGGASSLAVSGARLYASSSDQQQQLGMATNGSVGPSVDTGALPRLQRKLWLRTQ
ncbi:MAG TPA: hypothetical protein VK427_02655, partial [Kofleriaceae bacterium]|nr:hypothetical protein [Kofleriaceae bacterium]